MVVGDVMSLKKGKITIIVFLTVLISVQIVKSLGLTEPTAGISLLPGDSTRFNFQIQAVTSTDDQSCSYSISGMDPLVITFDEDETIVKAGEIKNIYGDISAPEDAEIKAYTGQLIVRCKPQVEDVSGSVVQRTMISDFSVSIVGTQKERKRRQLPTEQIPAEVSNLPIIIVIIVIIILVIGIYYWSEKRKKQS